MPASSRLWMSCILECYVLPLFIKLIRKHFLMHSCLIFKKSSFQRDLQAILIFVNTVVWSFENNIVVVPWGKKKNNQKGKDTSLIYV